MPDGSPFVLHFVTNEPILLNLWTHIWSASVMYILPHLHPLHSLKPHDRYRSHPEWRWSPRRRCLLLPLALAENHHCQHAHDTHCRHSPLRGSFCSTRALLAASCCHI